MSDVVMPRVRAVDFTYLALVTKRALEKIIGTRVIPEGLMQIGVLHALINFWQQVCTVKDEEYILDSYPNHQTYTLAYQIFTDKEIVSSGSREEENKFFSAALELAQKIFESKEVTAQDLETAKQSVEFWSKMYRRGVGERYIEVVGHHDDDE